MLLGCFFSDVDVEKPDEKSIMTYVAQFLKAYPEAGEYPAVSENLIMASHEKNENLGLPILKKYLIFNCYFFHRFSFLVILF